MNEVQQLVSFLTETLKQGLTVAQDKIPEFIQQTLAYGLFKARIGLGISFFMILFAIIALTYVIKKYPVKKSEWGYDFDITDWFAGFLLGFISVIFIIVSIITVSVCLSSLIQIKIAPMIYLIERVSMIR